MTNKPRCLPANYAGMFWEIEYSEICTIMCVLDIGERVKCLNAMLDMVCINYLFTNCITVKLNSLLITTNDYV